MSLIYVTIAFMSIWACTIAQPIVSSTCSNVGVNTTLSNNGTTCVCPYDRTGDHCEFYRSYTCVVKTLLPVAACEPFSAPSSYDNQLDSDPICHRFSNVPTAVMNFSFTIDCNFTDTRNILTGTSAAVTSSQEAQNLNFSYWTVVTANTTLGESRRFAMTATTYQGQFYMQLVNFWKMSDTSQARQITVNSAIMAGRQSINHTVPVGNVTAAFYTGGRLYFEAGLLTPYPPGLKRQERARLFLDTDRPLVYSRYVVSSPMFPYWIVLVTAAGVVVVILVIVTIYRRLKAARGRKELDKAIVAEFEASHNKKKTQ